MTDLKNYDGMCLNVSYLMHVSSGKEFLSIFLCPAYYVTYHISYLSDRKVNASIYVVNPFEDSYLFQTTNYVFVEFVLILIYKHVFCVNI